MKKLVISDKLVLPVWSLIKQNQFNEGSVAKTNKKMLTLQNYIKAVG